MTHAQCAIEGGGGTGVKQLAWVCARNYSGTQFTALIQSPIPDPIPDPGPPGYMVEELHGSCGSTIYQPGLKSIC